MKYQFPSQLTSKTINYHHLKELAFRVYKFVFLQYEIKPLFLMKQQLFSDLAICCQDIGLVRSVPHFVSKKQLIACCFDPSRVFLELKKDSTRIETTGHILLFAFVPQVFWLVSSLQQLIFFCCFLSISFQFQFSVKW